MAGTLITYMRVISIALVADRSNRSGDKRQVGIRFCFSSFDDLVLFKSQSMAFDSSVGRAWDCNGKNTQSQGHWFDPGSKDNVCLLPFEIAVMTH